MRDKFNIACRRFDPCARLPGSSIDHILPLLQALRSHPFPARAADSDGNEREFTADASQLAIVMFGAAPALATLRELDAAARAFADGDRVPLLRLMAETISAVDSRDPSRDRRDFQRRPRRGRHVPGPAADFRHALDAGAARRGSRPSHRGARAQGARHLCTVHHRGIPRHAARLQLHRSMRRMAGSAVQSSGVSRRRRGPALSGYTRAHHFGRSRRHHHPRRRRRGGGRSSTAPRSGSPTASMSTPCRMRAAAAPPKSSAGSRHLEPGRHLLRGRCSAPALGAALCRACGRLEPAAALAGNRAGERSYGGSLRP